MYILEYICINYILYIYIIIQEYGLLTVGPISPVSIPGKFTCVDKSRN